MLNLPWTAAAGEAVGVPWLLDAIAPAGQFGRHARSNERAFRRGDELLAERALERVERVARGAGDELLGALRAALVAPDPLDAIVRAQSGAVLADVEFFQVARFHDAVRQVESLAGRDAFAGVDLPHACPEVWEALEPGRTSGDGFYLSDAFSPKLARAREALEGRQAFYDAARSRLSESVARFAGVEHVRDGEFIVFRDGLSETLPPSLHVLRETPTYLLCEIALDADALAALDARDTAASEVAACEEAVRARLSATVAAAAPELERARAALGELDVLVARALFARRYACTPAHVAASGRIVLEGMRYLPLSEALADRGRPYAPLSFTLEGIGVVTGPNMGGKTAALKTLGFAAACLALGVPVPATAASLPLFDEIAWLGIGARAAGDEEEPLLSAFGSEIDAVRALLARAPQRSLVLIDEFARTTSPREGRALLIALLETLGSRGALALAATHLAGVTRASGAAHYASGRLRPLPASSSPVRLEEALVRLGEAMEYGLTRTDETGAAGSDAIALAEILGLDAALTERARDALRDE